MRVTALVLLVILLCVPAYSADQPAEAAAAAAAPAASTAQPAEKTVTLDVKDKPIADVLKQVAADTGSTVIAEKLVKGNVTVSVKDVPVEKALGAVAKAGDLQWQKVYVPIGSGYVKDGDALAAQVRLLLGLRFPDLIIAPSASYSPVVHLQKDATASSFISKIGKESGLVPVYLVTDDKAYTKKAAKDEAKAKSSKYMQLAKEMMDLFMEMSPEERADAMKQGMQYQMQNPEALADMMKAVMEMDPQYLNDMNQRAMQALMQMNPEARKNMLRASMRSQMQMMKNMDPQQMQRFQQEAMEIAKELMQSGEMPTPPGAGNPGQ